MNCSIPIKQIDFIQHNVTQSIGDLKNIKNNNNNTEFNDKFIIKVWISVVIMLLDAIVSLVVMWYGQIIELLIYGQIIELLIQTDAIVSLVVMWYGQIIELLIQTYVSLKCICQSSKLMHVKKYIFISLIAVINSLLLMLTIIELLCIAWICIVKTPLIIMIILMIVDILRLVILSNSLVVFDNNIVSGMSAVSLFIVQLLEAINDKSSSISCSNNLIWITYGHESVNLNLSKEPIQKSYIISCSVCLLFTTELIEIFIHVILFYFMVGEYKNNIYDITLYGDALSAILLINVAIIIHDSIGENIYSVSSFNITSQIQKPTAAPTYSRIQTPTILTLNPTVISTKILTDNKISPSFSQSNLLHFPPSISPTTAYPTMNPMQQQTSQNNILSGTIIDWKDISDSNIDSLRYNWTGTCLNATVLDCENLYILTSFPYKGYYYENQLFTMSKVHCNNQKVCERLQIEIVNGFDTLIDLEEQCFLENNNLFNYLYLYSAPYQLCTEQRQEIEITRNGFEFICNAPKSRGDGLFQIELNSKPNKFENITINDIYTNKKTENYFNITYLLFIFVCDFSFVIKIRMYFYI